MIDRTFIEPSIAELAKRQRDEQLYGFYALELHYQSDISTLFVYRKIVKQGRVDY